MLSPGSRTHAGPDSLSGTGDVGVRFGILGSLQVVVHGREVVLRSPKQRSLLGALLVNVGWVVSTDRLAELLWGDDQPDDASGAIQTHVSRVRSLLERHGGRQAARVLVTRPPGYVLAVQPEQVDAGRFERLVELAQAAPEPQAAAALVEEALALWRGRPLAEFDHHVARTEATRLTELRVHAREVRADALLALGRFPQVTSELEAAVAEHPLRERLRGQLMVALVRCGRQADALAVYRDLRDQLVAELGLEPSAALRRLELAILQQTGELPWPVAGTEAEGRWGDRSEPRQRVKDPTTRLPAALTSFVGRQDDVRGIADVLSQQRIVVLTGVGGVGKSRLALRVCHRLTDEYDDGVRWCDLAGATDAEAVADVVASDVGVPPADGAGSQDALIDFLRAQRSLLVLDNCEHVLAGVAELVDRVARTCPGVDVLATSRQPLGISGEQLWPVPPLDVANGPDAAAVELFCDRATAVDPSFDLDDADRDAVVEICRRLDGLPLAIELAAARVRSMTPADIAHRLDQRFRLLTSGPRGVAPRHRSLHAVVDWSYALLPDGSRRLFDRLAVFQGGFDLAAAEHVVAGDGVPAAQVAGGLSELVDHSLVTVDRSGRYARYRLLETLRAYGWAQLDDRNELRAWRQRHAEHFTSLAEEAAVGLRGPDEAHWVRIIDTEFANFRTAQAWALENGEVDLALRLPALLWTFAYYRLRDEVYTWALRALEMPGAKRSSAAAAARVVVGVGCMQRGDLQQAHHHAEKALMSASDEEVELHARNLLTEISLYRGRLEDTDRRGREIVERARAARCPYDEALGRLYRVHALAYAGRTAEALSQLAAGWQAVEQAGTPTLRAGYWYLEGEVRLDGDPSAALAMLATAIEIARSVDNRFIEGVARVTAASLEARHGEPEKALRAFRETVDHWRTSGDWAHMWTTLHNLLVLLARIGEDRPAAVLLGAVTTATTGAPAFGADADRLEASATSLRTSLGEQAFDDAVARGRSMSDADAVAYALQQVDRLLEEQPADVA